MLAARAFNQLVGGNSYRVHTTLSTHLSNIMTNVKTRSQWQASQIMLLSRHAPMHAQMDRQPENIMPSAPFIGRMPDEKA